MGYKSVSLLVIDDDTNFLKLVSHQFRNDINLELIQANSYLEGVSFAINRSFDLYLLDLQLDQGSGFEIMQLLSKETKIANRIVVVSQSESIDDRIRAYDLGASNFLKKPFDMKELRSIMRKNMKSLTLLSQSTIRVSDIWSAGV